MIVTTSNNIEEMKITEYLGIVSGESALGTGFLSSIGAGVADFLGSNSSMYSGKLSSARDIALRVMVGQAQKKHADAIIAVKVECISLSADIMGVMCTGTAVKLGASDVDSTSSLDVIATYPLRAENDTGSIHFLDAEIRGDGCMLSLTLYCPNPVRGILADITVSDIFGQAFKASSLAFTEYERIGVNKYRTEILAAFEKPIKAIDNISVFMQKRLFFNEQQPDTMDRKKIIDETTETNDSRSFSKLQLLQLQNTLLEFASATEMREYLSRINTTTPNELYTELYDELEKISDLERMYGKMKNDAVHCIEEFMGREIGNLEE